MQVHEIQPRHRSKSRKRVGRGGKKGTYSGKGIKGQASRAGRKMVPIIRELIKRYPKLKGYRRFKFGQDQVVVNLGVLEQQVDEGAVITPEYLVKQRIVHNIKGKVPKVKILGSGKLTKKITVENCQVSKSAKTAIEKSGGTVKS